MTDLTVRRSSTAAIMRVSAIVGSCSKIRPKTLLLLAGLLAGAFLHRGWFRPGLLTAGDWFPMSRGATEAAFHGPWLWDATTGMGHVDTALPLWPLQYLFGLVGWMGLSYGVAERVLVFFPFTFLPFLSAYVLAGRFTTRPLVRAASSAIYGLNTYILLVGSSQMTVALAYSFAPLAIAALFDAVDFVQRPIMSARKRLQLHRGNLLSAVAAGGWLGLVGTYDSRLALVVVLAVVFLTACSAIRARQIVIPVAVDIVVLSVFVLLNAYWIVPMFLHGSGSALTAMLPNSPWISWSDLGHSFALYHPFWTGHTPAVFVKQPISALAFFLPLAAFGSLLMPRLRKDWRIISLAGIALIGVFLNKGENAPFGNVYTWMFDYVPGMRLFREMSKFSLLTAMAYAILAPSCLEQLFERTKNVKTDRSYPSFLTWIAIALVCASILWTSRPALVGELGGTHTPTRTPVAYKDFDDTIMQDQSFGRVLWAPIFVRHGSRSVDHPPLALSDFSNAITAAGDGSPSADPLVDGLTHLRSPVSADDLRRFGVHYIAIVTGPAESTDSWPGRTPADKAAEIQTTLTRLKAQSGLTVIEESADLTVFSVSDASGFATLRSTTSSEFQNVNVTHQATSNRSLKLDPISLGEHILSVNETYDSGWKGEFTGYQANGKSVSLRASSEKTSDGLSSWRFTVPADVTRMTATFSYRPQWLATAGGIMSLVGMALVLGVWVFRRRIRAIQTMQLRDDNAPSNDLAGSTDEDALWGNSELNLIDRTDEMLSKGRS